MFILVLGRCVVTFHPQVFIRNVVIDDEISQNVVDENTIMVSVVTQVIMVPFVKRLCDCTMKSILFIGKMGRLNLELCRMARFCEKSSSVNFLS